MCMVSHGCGMCKQVLSQKGNFYPFLFCVSLGGQQGFFGARLSLGFYYLIGWLHLSWCCSDLRIRIWKETFLSVVQQCLPVDVQMAIFGNVMFFDKKPMMLCMLETSCQNGSDVHNQIFLS